MSDLAESPGPAGVATAAPGTGRDPAGDLRAGTGGDGPGAPAPAPGEGGPGRGGIDLAAAVGRILALVGFVLGARTIHDNSFLTHLATGRLILAEAAVPTVDPYSLLAAGEPWTVQSWLVSVVYAALDAVAGGWAVRVANGAAGAGIVLGLWGLVAPARQLITRVVLVGFALLVGSYLWPPRPLLFGLVLMVVTLQVVAGNRPRWWLVPVFWLWVNSHGSFVLGVGLVGAVLVGAAIDRRRIPRDEVMTFAFAIAGCLSALVGPVGWRLLWFPFHMMARSEALERVSEWKSPTFRSPVEALFGALVVLIVVAANRGARWRALVPSLAFVAAGMLAVRNIGLAAVVVVALLAPHLADLAGSVDGGVRGLVPRALQAVTLAGGCVLVVAVALSAPVDLDDYPVDHVDWLEDRALVADPDVRLAQRDYVGNYLTLRYGRRARVFMDDRFDFFPQPVIDDHNALLLGGDIAEVVERNRFDVVLWATDGPFHRWIRSSDDWVVVRGDDDWFVACRVSGPVADRCLDR